MTEHATLALSDAVAAELSTLLSDPMADPGPAIDEVTPAQRRDASRVTTVLRALLTAEREVIAAARAALTIEDEDVRDALVSTLSEQRRALHTLRHNISEV